MATSNANREKVNRFIVKFMLKHTVNTPFRNLAS